MMKYFPGPVGLPLHQIPPPPGAHPLKPQQIVFSPPLYRQTGRQTHRQKNTQTDKDTDKNTDMQTEKYTDR